jgi:serine O-acetyltransferase
MIKSKKDYKFYLKSDYYSLGRDCIKNYPLVERIAYVLFADEIWKFQKTLRKVEYLQNCGHGIISKIRLYLVLFRFRHLSVKLGYDIHPNCFGPGLAIAHRGTIIVNADARIGENCRIYTDVNIGNQRGDVKNRVPTIGNNVFIAPGVKIFDSIVIADDIAIGANSVVNKSFTEPCITIVGVPARKSSNKGSKGILTLGTQIASKT